MRVVSQILPVKLRHRLRGSFDSLYSKPLPDKVTMGALSQWTIATRTLHPGAVVYSGGVGEDITFEQTLIQNFGVRIHIFDPSPVAPGTIAAANLDALMFKPLGLAATPSARFSVGGGADSKVWFKAGVGQEIPCTNIAQEMAENGHDAIDLLKIDIEGFEYEVLEGCLENQIPIKQICVEFHDFFPEIPKTRTKNLIRLLESKGYQLIHRHRHDHTFLHRSAW
jgi:FkbM family methyltransferase